MSGSTMRRSSFALGTVVRMVSCLSSEAAMFRNIAQRCGALRLNWRPDNWWRMKTYSSILSNQIAIVVPLQADRRPIVQAHAQCQTVAFQYFLDFGKRLLSQVRRAE